MTRQVKEADEIRNFIKQQLVSWGAKSAYFSHISVELLPPEMYEGAANWSATLALCSEEEQALFQKAVAFAQKNFDLRAIPYGSSTF
jgi:hypothetical protein